MNGRVAWIGGIEKSASRIAEALDAGLAAVGRLPVAGEQWAVKLNLTYPRYLPGVVNCPAFMEGLCQWGRDHRVKIVFIA